MRGALLLRSGVRPLRDLGLALVVAFALAAPAVAGPLAPPVGAVGSAIEAGAAATTGPTLATIRGVDPTPIEPEAVHRHQPSFGKAPYGFLVLFAAVLGAAILAWRVQPPRSPHPHPRPPHRHAPL